MAEGIWTEGGEAAAEVGDREGETRVCRVMITGWGITAFWEGSAGYTLFWTQFFYLVFSFPQFEGFVSWTITKEFVSRGYTLSVIMCSRILPQVFGKISIIQVDEFNTTKSFAQAGSQYVPS